MGIWAAVIILLFVVSGILFAFVEYKKRGGFGADRRKMDLAMVQLNQQLRINPNDAMAYAKRGIIRHKKGDNKGALADLDKALELDPSQVDAHYQRGMVLMLLNQYSAAEKEFHWITNNSEDPFFKTAVRQRLSELKTKRFKSS